MILRKNKLCSLCKDKYADKVNSHIIPKYILKTIFESDAGINRAYLTATNLGHKPTEKKQDSPKEKYLLCLDCEKRLENIETYCANKIKLPSRANYSLSEYFDIVKVEDGLEKIICKKVNSTIHTLLILSILWRLSAATFKAFEQFSITDKELELTRQTLLQRTDVDYNRFLMLNENKINLKFSYVLLTSHHDTIRLQKLLFVHPGCINPYYIILGEYILFTNFNDMHWDNNFRGFFNYKNDNVVISRVKSDSWEETLDLFYSKFRDSCWFHLKKNNIKPHRSRINNNGTQQNA